MGKLLNLISLYKYVIPEANYFYFDIRGSIGYSASRILLDIVSKKIQEERMKG